MDVTVMSGVTDRNTVQVLIETSYHDVFICVLFSCFINNICSGIRDSFSICLTVPHIYCNALYRL